MANATQKVAKGTVTRVSQFRKRSSVTLASSLQFYVNGMLGITTAGYLAKFDDTQSMIFAGLVRGKEGNPLLPAGTAGDADLGLDYDMPQAFELAFSSIAVTDIGKNVYASFDQTGVLDGLSTTYGNLVGQLVDRISSTIGLVEPVYDGIAGNKRLGAAKRLSATGTQTLSKWDIGKTIFCANTATLTINLPPIADVPAGCGFLMVKDHASDANAITLDADGSENIDGATTLATLDAAWDTAFLMSNGARWIVAYRDIA